MASRKRKRSEEQDDAHSKHEKTRTEQGQKEKRQKTLPFKEADASSDEETKLDVDLVPHGFEVKETWRTVSSVTRDFAMHLVAKAVSSTTSATRASRRQRLKGHLGRLTKLIRARLKDLPVPPRTWHYDTLKDQVQRLESLVVSEKPQVEDMTHELRKLEKECDELGKYLQDFEESAKDEEMRFAALHKRKLHPLLHLPESAPLRYSATASRHRQLKTLLQPAAPAPEDKGLSKVAKALAGAKPLRRLGDDARVAEKTMTALHRLEELLDERLPPSCDV